MEPWRTQVFKAKNELQNEKKHIYNDCTDCSLKVFLK